MFESTKKRWRESFRFKILVLLFLFILISSLIMQYGLGNNGFGVGNTVLGDAKTELKLESNSTYYYTAEITRDGGALGFASDTELEYYIFFENISRGTTVSDFPSSEKNGTSKAESYFIPEPSIVTLVIITPENSARFTFEIREYTTEEISKIQWYGVGGLFRTISYLILLIIIIFEYLGPWILNRTKKQS